MTAAEVLPGQGTEQGRHLVDLPGTGWKLWRDAVIRSTGFPVSGLTRFSAPEAARVADAHLAGTVGEAEFAAAFAAAARAGLLDARDIARDPLFREAVTWQGRNVLFAIDGAAKADETTSRAAKQRQREIAVLRYWQRYCTKNETIGFFGPVTWVRFDRDAPTITVHAGPGLVRDRIVRLEFWALQALAERFGEDPEVRRWYPVSLHPHYALRGKQILRSTQPPVTLSPAEAEVLARCDGTAPAWAVAESVVADGVPGVRRPEDVLALFDVFVERGLVRWDADLPDSWAAETVLRQRIAALPDAAARERLLADLDRLLAGRDAVVAAAGDEARLREALRALDAEFTELTGRDAQRRPGQMYAGRTVCVEDTSRDLDIVFGPGLLAPIARPLEVLLLAARWVTQEIARVYLAALRELYDDLAGELGSPDVPLGRLWFLAQGLIFGAGDKPSDEVSAEFTRRWGELFGLADAGEGEVRVSAADIADRVASVFAARRPGWRHARLHSPDVTICAASVAAIQRGDFFAVLGEMHTASATMDLPLMVQFHPRLDELNAGFAEDLRPGRMLPLVPPSWPRYGARVSPCLRGPDDLQLGLDVASGADRDRLWPMAAVTIRDEGGALVAHGPTGAGLPIIEVFADLLWVYAVDSFKLVAAAAHTPRISIDRLVVARETWRTTVGDVGLDAIGDERELYLAARRWRLRLGLPDRVFVKIATEVKPFYLDLTSPQHVGSLRRVLASARTDGGEGVSVVLTELLPGPEHAWLPDGQDRRYHSELRMHLRDPLAAEPAYDDQPAYDDPSGARP